MSVKCELCEEEFGSITGNHLKSAHNTDIFEYRRMFPNAGMVSEEMRHSISEKLMGYKHTEEAKQAMGKAKLGNQYGLGSTYVHTEEAKRKMSKAKLGNHYSLGYVHTEEARQAMSKAQMGNQNALGSHGTLGHVHTKETRKKMSEAKLDNQYFLGHIHTEETKQAISKVMSKAMLGNQNALGNVPTEESKQLMSEAHKEQWKDPKFADMMAKAQNRRPNGPELQLQSVLDKHSPGEWKYTGDGTFWIEGKNPDFMNVNGKKQVIEIFGYHWHDPYYFPNRLSEEELIAHYKGYGFDCLVFWEYDVYNEEEVVERVKSFQVAK